MPQPPNLNGRNEMIGCAWATTGILLAVALLIFAISFMVRSCRTSGAATTAGGSQGSALPGNSSNQGPGKPEIGLPLEKLKATSIPMTGNWQEEDTFIPDKFSWAGSTCVVGTDRDSVYLVTNLHCLGVVGEEGLFQADSDGSAPEISAYSIHLHFPSGYVKPATQFSMLGSGVDLAILTVEKSGLHEGRDYQVLPRNDQFPRKEGTEVVVIGSPLEPALSGTHTFGRISALRPATDDSGNPYTFIQTDAAINHGNSGGPLLAKSGDRYLWIGVSTARMDSAEALGFAIDISYLSSTNPTLSFYPATAEGMTRFYTSMTQDPP